VDTYNTITGRAEGAYSEQRSKFLAFALPVTTPEEVKAAVADFRKQYYDARHVCWAYVLGADRTQFRVNDDGEPSSTAGKPILGVIHSHHLTNILIVVVRYFGGVKLGTSGLIVAYRTAAQEAIQAATIVEKDLESDLLIQFEYPQLNAVMKIIKDASLHILSQDFDNACRMQLRIPQRQLAHIRAELAALRVCVRTPRPHLRTGEVDPASSAG
jgi:uncharacterized YigZ family protein